MRISWRSVRRVLSHSPAWLVEASLSAFRKVGLLATLGGGAVLLRHVLRKLQRDAFYHFVVCQVIPLKSYSACHLKLRTLSALL